MIAKLYKGLNSSCHYKKPSELKSPILINLDRKLDCKLYDSILRLGSPESGIY